MATHASKPRHHTDVDELWRQLEESKTHVNERRAKLEATIAEYERRYGFPSSEIHDRIEAGTLHETYDVCQWIFEVNALDRLNNRQNG